MTKVIEDASELTIGNKDYYPSIELKRKWEIDDKRTKRLERMEKIFKGKGIHKTSFYANVKLKNTTKSLDKFFGYYEKKLKN